ncbi:MAG: threonine ammonia-lyase [Longimicrobiales bacterium]
MITLETIRDARTHIAEHIHRTPLVSVTSIGRPFGVHLFAKAELFQKTGSFKVRGVLNRIRQLSDAEKARGLIGISAGNHAAALAWAATAAGVRSTVVMPAHASPAKVEASRNYGADIILHGDVFAAFARMEELRDQHGYTLVHPFDDEAIIAGHGTLGLEILEDLHDVDVVLVPTGGGGLLSGVATAIKALRPAARVIGVEPEGAADVRAGLDAGRVVRLDRIETIADGLAPPMTGEHVLEHVRAFVDDVVTVPDDAILRAMRTIMTRAKLFVEPSGAAGLAALEAGAVRAGNGSRIVIVASGGNVDLSRLREQL